MWREQRSADESWFPGNLAELMRSGLDELAAEICAAIGDSVPEYRSSYPALPPIRPFAETVLFTFVARLDDPAAPLDHLEGPCRRFGQSEAARGHPLDSVHTAFQVGSRVSWRQVMRFSRHNDLPTEVVARLAEVQLAFVDELTRLVEAGYAEARTQTPEERAGLRLRLVRLLVGRPVPPPGALAEMAAQAGWTVPAELSAVAVRPGSRWVHTALDGDVLVDLTAAEPYLLVPGPITRERLAMLRRALPRGWYAIGLSVPPDTAADSLLWARRALGLAGRGVIEEAPVTRCEDHLLTLWLMADPALIEELERRHLLALDALPDQKRRLLRDTLRVWLETWSTAADVGALLHIHPQTVRYRLRQLREYLGRGLDDPEERFGLELTLRATGLKDRGATRTAELHDDGSVHLTAPGESGHAERGAR